MTVFTFERGDPGFTDHTRLLVELHDAREIIANGRLSAPARVQARAGYVEYWLRCQELRRLNVRLALGEGEQAMELGSITNLVWGELCKEIAEFTAELAGSIALVAASRIAHHRIASRAKSIYSGTSEVQRNIIAERLLGLPR